MKLHNNNLKLHNTFPCSSLGVTKTKLVKQKCMCKANFRIKMYVQAHFSNKNACVGTFFDRERK